MNDKDIAVVPYVCYDALMERFERSQKNLRYSNIVSLVLSIALGLLLLVGVGATNGYRKNSLHG